MRNATSRRALTIRHSRARKRIQNNVDRVQRIRLSRSGLERRQELAQGVGAARGAG